MRLGSVQPLRIAMTPSSPAARVRALRLRNTGETPPPARRDAAVACVSVHAVLGATLAAATPHAALAQSDADIARQLVNPFTTLVRVPVELDYDRKIGPADAGRTYSLVAQPVIPFSLNDNWSLISRTILSFVSQREIFPGSGTQTGLSDTLQSFFFSPRQQTRGGISWGVGPVFLLPTASDELLGSRKWGLGPTGGAFRDAGPWTVGILANHIWSVAGRGSETISSTFLQPLVSYTTDDAWSYTLQTEATYYWKLREWSVPLEASVGKLVKIGGHDVNFEGGVRYWVTNPDSGPKGWGLSFTVTFAFPK